MQGLAIAYCDLPAELIAQHQLEPLARDRGGERELWFLRHAKTPLLPVWRDGQFEVLRWGRRGCGLTWQTTIDSGKCVGAEPIDILASAGYENGFWFRIRRGVRGIYWNGEAFMIVTPASYYYRTMTRSDRMPVLIGEII